MRKRFCAALVCLALLLAAFPSRAAETWDWNKAYYGFLMDGFFKYAKQKYFVNPDNWEVPRFALRDLDLDGVPELLAYNGCGYTADARGYVYTFHNGRVFYCGEIGNLDENFYYEGNTRYPGLFYDSSDRDQHFSLYYVRLEGTRLVRQRVAVWNWPYETEAWNAVEPDKPLIVEIPAAYAPVTRDRALYDLADTYLRIAAKNEDLPPDYTRLQLYSIRQISAMGWDAFTAGYGAAGSASVWNQPVRFWFDPDGTAQLGILWETDDTRLYAVTGENALTGEPAYSVRAGNPGRYGDDYFDVSDGTVYAFTLSALDAATREPVERTTVYVSVTFAQPRTQEEMVQEVYRLSRQKLVGQMGKAGTEENALLNTLCQDYEKSFANIYMGELEDNLTYQISSAGYSILSDTVGFAIDGINDIINDPVEMELIQVLTDYLTSREGVTAEQFKHYADRVSWVGDIGEFFISGDNWNDLMQSLDSGISAMNTGLEKIFNKIPDDLFKGVKKYLLGNSSLADQINKHTKKINNAGKFFSGVAAVIETGVKVKRNTDVVSILTGNYMENISILGELAERAKTEQMKNAIRRVTRWMTNHLEDDLAQVYDEASALGKWVLNLAVDWSVEVLAEKAAGGGVKALGNGLGGFLLGQAIGSLVTKSAGDFIGANEKVAAANAAARILKLETEYAVLNGDVRAFTWLDLFAKEMWTMNNATVLAVDAVHRGSFLRAVGDWIRNNKGRELNDRDYDMISEDSNRIAGHRTQLARCLEQYTAEAEQEVRWENKLETGIVVYGPPERAVIADDWAPLYASYHSADPEHLVCELPKGSAAEILGELFSAKNGTLWYLIRFDDTQCAFAAASCVQR
ncbi:MAG: hypothetical protein IKQ41_09580 [Clostridia bacterium]|nr:hypothetical protein [Clostridia bacterium]